jgi:hypothetical protein
MIIRTYDETENNIIKVWTPERIADVKAHRSIGGFNTKTLDIDPAEAERYGMSVDELEYDAVMYVDNAMSICRNTSGWDTVLCQEHVKDRILYRCFICHHEEQKTTYCKAINSSGRRCTNVPKGQEQWPDKYFRSDTGDYCSRHTDFAERKELPHSLESLDEYLEDWEMETVRQFKRDFIEKLKYMGDISLNALIAMKNELRVAPSAPLGAKELKELGETYVVSPTADYTYFILCEGYVKIGKSKNPFLRFEALTREGDLTIRPEGINISTATLLGYVVGGGKLERELHYLFEDKRVAGEWFHYDTKIAKAIQVFIGSEDKTMEWLLEDLINNYEFLMNYETYGADWDPEEDLENQDKISRLGHLLNRNEKARKIEYGF